jgi:hypothetical protein
LEEAEALGVDRDKKIIKKAFIKILRFVVAFYLWCIVLVKLNSYWFQLVELNSLKAWVVKCLRVGYKATHHTAGFGARRGRTTP